MEFNLVTERWIPVLRRDGEEDMLAPWQVTDGYDSNPVVSLNSPRADFNGALMQFLIGLLQTVAAPQDEDEWEDFFEDPPGPEILKEKFLEVSHAFELLGNGPRFMQDIEELDVEPLSVGSLLIDAPGENTLKNNLDHFVKRGLVNVMCPPCCAAAIFTLQTNAPSGGAGHRTSLRGGGPLTTLVKSGSSGEGTLWRDVWLNVLEEDVFLRRCGNPEKKDDADIFPWLVKTRTSEKGKGSGITPEDVHPAYMFWAMPRRIRLDIDDMEDGTCNLCGGTSGKLVRSYKTKNYGNHYQGHWRHPLSPYYRGRKGELLPVHGQPGGVTYRHWLGLVQEDRESGKEPAYVVHAFRLKRQQGDRGFRLHAFGYDMDKMKARCWYEGTMPLILLPDKLRHTYERSVEGMVRAAYVVAKNLSASVKHALFYKVKEIDKAGYPVWEAPRQVEKKIKDKTIFNQLDDKFWQDAEREFYTALSQLDDKFWQDTESEFYTALAAIKSSLENGRDSLEIRKQWHRTLCRVAEEIFDFLVCNGPVEEADPRRIVFARRELAGRNNSKKVKIDMLDLPVHEKKTRKEEA